MLLASAMFAVMGAFVKLSAEHGASLPQVVLFRGLPSVVLLLIWARAGRQSIVPTSWRLHVWRNVSGVTSMWLGFFAIAHLPLATATSLNYTAPLFIACWMLGWGGAQRDLVRIVSVALGFIGVIAVLRPSIADDQWLAALLGLGAGALSAVAMMQIRQLGRVGEPEWRTVLLFFGRRLPEQRSRPFARWLGAGRFAWLCCPRGSGHGRSGRPTGHDARVRAWLGPADGGLAILHHYLCGLDRHFGLGRYARWAGLGRYGAYHRRRPAIRLAYHERSGARLMPCCLL